MKKLLPFILLMTCVFLLTTCEERERSNPVDFNADPDAWAPSNLQAELINDSEIKLTWTQEEERISGFKIGRKAGSGSFTQIAEVDADVTEYTDTGLNCGTDYTYRVQAFTDDNESGYVEITVYTPICLIFQEDFSGSTIPDDWSTSTYADFYIENGRLTIEGDDDGYIHSASTVGGALPTSISDPDLTIEIWDIYFTGDQTPNISIALGTSLYENGEWTNWRRYHFFINTNENTYSFYKLIGDPYTWENLFSGTYSLSDNMDMRLKYNHSTSTFHLYIDEELLTSYGYSLEDGEVFDEIVVAGQMESKTQFDNIELTGK